MSHNVLTAENLLANSNDYNFEDEAFYINVTEIVKLRELLESGNVELAVDLEGDSVIDDGTEPSLEFEFIPVLGALEETAECIVVLFKGINNYGLPPYHNLRIGFFQTM